MDGWMVGSVVLAFVNIAIAGALLGLYRVLYVRLKAGFTLALLVFAGAFLVQNLIVCLAWFTMYPELPAAASPYFFAMGSAEATGLGAVAWTTIL